MNASWSASGGQCAGNFSARLTEPVTSMACGAAQSTGMSVGWLVAGSMPRHVPADQTFDWSTSATLPLNASCWLLGPGSCRPHSMRRSPDCRQALSPDHSRLTVNRLSGSNFGPRYWRAAAWHCSWLICWIRAVDGGAASGPYSLPGNVRMSIDSATSKRCSSVQSTICGRVGRALRPVQAVAALGVVERVVAARPERRSPAVSRAGPCRPRRGAAR